MVVCDGDPLMTACVLCSCLFVRVSVVRVCVVRGARTLRLRLSVVHSFVVCVGRVFARVIECGAHVCCVWCTPLTTECGACSFVVCEACVCSCD